MDDPEAGPVAKTFRGYSGAGVLDLAPWEIRALPSAVGISAFGSAEQALVADVDYDVSGESESGTYLSLYFGTQLSRQRVAYRVSVTALWGMAECPPDVEEAAWICIAAAWRNPESADVRDTGSMELGEAAVDITAPPTAFPPRAREKLENYRRGTGI
jgi:hypothetical protein